MTRFLTSAIYRGLAVMAMLALALPVSSAVAQDGELAKFERLPAPKRLVAIGDSHGHLNPLRVGLQKAGAIDGDNSWVGGELVVVITGDFLDRGPDEIQIMELFDKLQPEARAAGGALHVLNGNHEIMNIQGSFWAVSPIGYKGFAIMFKDRLDIEDPEVKKYPPAQRHRYAAFRPGGPYARKLARYPFFIIVGDTVFVHGGISPDHVRYGLEKLNREVVEWMAGKAETVDPKLLDRASPIWLRDYSKEPDDADCKSLGEALALMKVKRMVVGHSIQAHINSSCDEQIWKIDTGMNPAYFGGPVEVLEIIGDKVSVIK